MADLTSGKHILQESQNKSSEAGGAPLVGRLGHGRLPDLRAAGQPRQRLRPFDDPVPLAPVGPGGSAAAATGDRFGAHQPRLSASSRHVAREGWPVNHKRLYQLYSEERADLRRCNPRRRRSCVARQRAPVANGPRQRWAMDFMRDELSGGQEIRVMTVIDVLTRECLA